MGSGLLGAKLKAYINALSDVDKKDQTELTIAIGNAIEDYFTGVIGTVNLCAQPTVYSGYLDCFGSEASRTIYSALFSVISTTFGSGDASTTFNLPNMSGYYFVEEYTTDWVENDDDDWTAKALGDDLGGNVEHYLDSDISELDIRLYISSDGTDANSFQALRGSANTSGSERGFSVFQVDDNSFKLITGPNGIYYVTSAGGNGYLDTEVSWYYKIVVTKKIMNPNFSWGIKY